MLSVHGRIVGGDCGVFEEFELISVGRYGKYSCVAPVNVMLHVVAMFGRGGFYVANGVSKVIPIINSHLYLDNKKKQSKSNYSITNTTLSIETKSQPI